VTDQVEQGVTGSSGRADAGERNVPEQPHPATRQPNSVEEQPHPALRTKLCELVGVRYPIVQTGMGWVAGARLVSATAEAGALGILASATMTLEQLRDAIGEVRSRTDAPFGVNLRTDSPDIAARVSLLIESKVRVASFAQAPRPDLVKQLRNEGIVVMPTVGARRHAEKVAEWGVDFVIAQGAEGGGHTGDIPTTLLVPQVVEAVADRVGVIAAGGFHSGAGLVAALAWGASGIAMGTRFLLTKESTVPDSVKALYLATPVTGTVVTRAVDGAPQRVVRTDLIGHLEGAGRLAAMPRAARNALNFSRETGDSMISLLREGRAMKKSSDLSWAQVVMAANAPMMTKAALVDGRTDVGVLPTGQVVGTIDSLPTVAELVAGIVREANATLDRLCR
jgi:NAD(P)H-dependent flavin oxidoreductase YrpB (nitropropane dioxygenase family)